MADPTELIPNRTKIVATLGPASDNEDVITRLAQAGADVFRLNCAHADHENLARKVGIIRKVAKALGQPIGILADLQGPKMRIGPFKDAEPIWLQREDQLVISTAEGVIGVAPKEGEVTRVGTGYAHLSRDVKVGETILLDDGNIELLVEQVRGDEVSTRVIVGGLLKQFKGINLPGSAVSAPTISQKDLADLRCVLDLEVDFVALSFVRTADDVRQLKSEIERVGSDVQVISKIERPEAIKNFDDILTESYGIMVARGDMGVELGPEVVPALQKQIIARSVTASKPVITATQMLESMITNPRPTRAEASDVANAIYDGTSAVMLSAETASGKHPVRTVAVMDGIARHTERDIFANWQYNLKYQSREHRTTVPLATVRAAAFGALEVGAKLVAVFTESGATARRLSGERISTPVFAFTPHQRTLQRLALSWGINARLVTAKQTSEEVVKEGEQILLDEGLVKPGEHVVMIFGTSRQSGLTNTMNIRRVGSDPNQPESVDSMRDSMRPSRSE